MKILVTSSKGGIGKSTLSAGLALAFAQMGKRVLLIDCDLGGRSLDMFLGTEDSVLFDVGDVAMGRCRPDDALRNPWDTVNLFFCPSPAVYHPGDFDGDALVDAIRALEGACGAEVVICDTAGMICAPDIARKYAKTVLVLSTQQPASVRAAESTAMLMGDYGITDAKLVISNFEWKSAEKGSRAGILDIIDGAGVQCIGIVPHDRTLMLAGEAGNQPPKRSLGMQAFANIADRLCGYNVKLFSGMDKISGKKAL